MGAFHAYDVRGIYNVDFDKTTVYKIGFFLPELLSADKVLVGRDCRTSSDEIHEWLLKGITDAGADVYDIGLSTTPMVYFGTANYGFKASVQITASHNPKEYNGLKVSRENALPVGLETGLGQIKAWIDEGKPIVPVEKKGKVYNNDIKQDYLNFLKKYKGDLSCLNIAFDLSNGMASLLAHDIFGKEPAYIYDNLDGTFPNHEPNPLIHDNVVALENLVKEKKADVGVIYDGDADRVMFVDEKGKVYNNDIKQDYLNFLKKYKGDLSCLNIAFDLSNGMASLLAHDIFGKEPAYIYDNLDGTFPNHEPNPLIHDNVVALENLVKEKKADVGVIYDGDADRVMFVDEKGRFIAPDLIIALLGHYFVDERGEKGIVLQDIRSSKAIGEYLAPMGCRVETWKVGRANAAVKLRELDGLWGGELAGHYYFRDFFYSDSGILASLIVLRVVAAMKKKGVTLSELIAKIARYQNSGEINFRVNDKLGAMNAVRDYFINEQKPTAEMDFDGYRVEFPTWWFNIRPSNTEPYLRFICEAESKDLLDSKVSKVEEIISKQFGGTR